MPRFHLRAVAALLALSLMVRARAEDAGQRVELSKLDRSISKEPAYHSKTPEYCLLVFGPRAETCVWVVNDHEKLYIDRNGNGDLTESGEAVAKSDYGETFSCGDITSRDGKTTYRSLSVARLGDGYRLRVGTPSYSVQMVGLGATERPQFASSAQQAPIIHFDGPLSLTQFSTKRVIPRGAGASATRETSLRVMIGTSGLGAGTFAAYNCRACENRGPMMGQFVFRSAGGGPQIEFTQELQKIG
jgi:hypothetical protein